MKLFPNTPKFKVQFWVTSILFMVILVGTVWIIDANVVVPESWGEWFTKRHFLLRILMLCAWYGVVMVVLNPFIKGLHWLVKKVI